MKIYVAAGFAAYETARAVVDMLKGMGHEITYDWTRTHAFDMDGDYITNAHWMPSENAWFATKDLDGVRNADLFIILAWTKPQGGWIEMGCALACNVDCWVVNPTRHTVFFDLPGVRILDGLEDVARALII